MLDRDDPLLHEIMGKVQALELLMETLFSDFAMRADADPLEGIRRTRLMLFSSLQNLDRRQDAFDDAVWEEMTRALNQRLANVTAQLEHRFPR